MDLQCGNTLPPIIVLLYAQKISQHLAIFIDFAKSLSVHDFFIPAVVCSGFGIQMNIVMSFSFGLSPNVCSLL